MGEALKHVVESARRMVRGHRSLAAASEPLADAPPAVAMMCPQCGYDFRVQRVGPFPEGTFGYLWVCQCVTWYVPPGGMHPELLQP